MWRLWRWLRPPMDQLTAMALLVRATDKDNPGWGTIEIVRMPDGSVTFRVLQQGRLKKVVVNAEKADAN